MSSECFHPPSGPNKGGAGHDDAVRTAGVCVSSMAGKGALVLVEASCDSCAVIVCDAIGRLLKLLTNAGDGGARDVDADVSNRCEEGGDVGRAMESGGGNVIEEVVPVAMSSNLAATPSEMYN